MKVTPSHYEALKAEVRRRREAGELPATISDAERADWAYGNAAAENLEVTREMAERAVKERREPR